MFKAMFKAKYHGPDFEEIVTVYRLNVGGTWAEINGLHDNDKGERRLVPTSQLSSFTPIREAEACETCGGTGEGPIASEQDCETCGGSGVAPAPTGTLSEEDAERAEADLKRMLPLTTYTVLGVYAEPNYYTGGEHPYERFAETFAAYDAKAAEGLAHDWATAQGSAGIIIAAVLEGAIESALLNYP